jgi:transcriptional regulator with XRE-family HTH domain
MDRGTELSDFLKACRARLTPDRAGLADSGRVRRVPGLRRDEVARLANVSVDYYTRLEQGRSTNPSPEIIDALATALQLDASERLHLRDLCGPGRRASGAAQRVRPGLLLTLRSLEQVPAFIVGRRTDVLAMNHLAREVIADFEAMPAADRNMARYTLLDPVARERLIDWERAAADTVAVLRFEAGRHPGDRRLADLVGELSAGCPEFSDWWNDHRVLRRTHGVKRYRHPVVGELDFAYESFEAPGDPDQCLCVYNVEPGSVTAESLSLLASWTADQRLG